MSDHHTNFLEVKRVLNIALAGPIFKIRALGTQIVFIGSASLLAEICDEKRFRKCVTGPVVEIRHAVHDGLFTAYEDEKIWGVAHRIMAPLLTKESVEESFVDMRDTAQELVEKWRGAPKELRVDVVGDLKRITLQAVMRCFFDQRQDCMSGVEPAMIKAMDSATLGCEEADEAEGTELVGLSERF